MGDGVKLPESERPDASLISKRLDEKIPRRIQNLFVQDIQNDCGCKTETYDSDSLHNAIYLSEEGIKYSNLEKIPLPMMNDISEKDIISLLEAACKQAGNEQGDLVMSNMLYNPADQIRKVYIAFEKYIHPVHINRSGDIYGWFPMDFVPLGYIYLIPEPEYFGVISANIDKFGAFCFANNIIKVDLKEVEKWLT